MLLHKRYFCPIFKSHVLFYIGNAEDTIEHLEREYGIDIEEDWSSCIGITLQENSEDRTYYIVWIKNKNDLSTTGHECLHLVYRIFQDRGILLTFDNQETVAYYLSYWFEILSSPTKRGNKIKGKI